MTTKLQQSINALVSTLTPDQRLLFKDVCDALAHSYYEVGEVLKCVAIDLIPSKIQNKYPPSIAKEEEQALYYDDRHAFETRGKLHPQFSPATKTKGDPLQELVSSMPESQRRSLIEKLQQSTSDKGDVK